VRCGKGRSRVQCPSVTSLTNAFLDRLSKCTDNPANRPEATRQTLGERGVLSNQEQLALDVSPANPTGYGITPGLANARWLAAGNRRGHLDASDLLANR
jgi:hypothetical protein